MNLLPLLALLALTGCADWFGTIGSHASPGDGMVEVAKTEGHANGSYIVSERSGEFVWTWERYGCVYKRAWFRWEPCVVPGKPTKGMTLVRMDYNYGPMMRAWERNIDGR